jgi:hypothetical protein
MSIDNFALEVQSQADKMFPNRTDTSMFLKMFSELGEMIDAKTREEQEAEYADVMIMLLDFGSRKMFHIEAAIRRKQAINAARKWQVNELGVMSHVKQ